MSNIIRHKLKMISKIHPT